MLHEFDAVAVIGVNQEGSVSHQYAVGARALLRSVLRNRWRIVGTHLLYTVVGLVILLPSIGFIAHLALAMSGKTALTNLDILFFALTPLGAASLVLFGAFLLFVLAFEQAAFLTIAASSISGHRMTVLAVVMHSLSQSIRILDFAWRLVLRTLIITLPFVVAAAGIFLYLLTDYDINFYLNSQPPEFWTAVRLIIVVFAGMSFVLVRKLLDWSMSLPLLLFGDTSPARCFRDSTTAMRGSRRRLLFRLAVCACASLMMSTAMFLITWLVGDLVVPLAINSTMWLLFALGGVVAIGALGGFIVAAFSSAGFAYVVVDTFYRTIPDVAESAPVPDPGRRGAGIIARLTVRQLALLLIAGVAAAGLTGYWLVNGVPLLDEVSVIAHRGAAGHAPENTISAVRQAIEDNADWIEIDVQETADGKVVLLHDSDFMKLSGIDLKIWDSTLTQIREIDVGSWFAPEFSDQRIPTLAEVLQLTQGKSGVIIELKYYGHNERLEERVVEIVEQSDMVDDVMIMSLDYKGLRKMRELRPEWTIGLLAAEVVGNLSQLDVDFLAVKLRLLSPELMLAAGNAGKQVFVWTLNDAYNMTRAISFGVDGIITDEPALARKVLEDRASLTPTERLLLHTALLLGQQPPTRSYRDDSP